MCGVCLCGVCVVCVFDVFVWSGMCVVWFVGCVCDVYVECVYIGCVCDVKCVCV